MGPAGMLWQYSPAPACAEVVLFSLCCPAVSIKAPQAAEFLQAVGSFHLIALVCFSRRVQVCHRTDRYDTAKSLPGSREAAGSQGAKGI